jgi:glycosyltransferase involved in cell wall biosynthesis
MATSNPRYSVVIPCYNEEDVIADTVSQISATLDGDGNYEVIIVDDGSTDRTASVVDRLVQEHPAVRVLTPPRNHGYGATLKSGILQAKGDLIVIIDADGSYPIADIPKLVAACADQDMVVGAGTGQDVQCSRTRERPRPDRERELNMAHRSLRHLGCVTVW